MPLPQLPQLVTAIGGLGTAAFGLVDATKVFWGGANWIGYSGLKNGIAPLLPVAGAGSPQQSLLLTVRANWFNGNDLASQKAIAKSLVKLNLSPGNAAAVAAAAGVDPTMLTAVATSITSGTALTPPQSDFFARFDLMVTAMLDRTFQHADQVYRNGTRALATAFALGLALAGAAVVPVGYGTALLIGLLATPLAPIAKDLSTALATAVDTLQLVKK